MKQLTGEAQNKIRSYYPSYDDFLEHAVIMADRFKISISEGVQQALGRDFNTLMQVLELGGKTMQDVEKDCQQTFIYKNHEEFYQAQGVNRDWLKVNKLS